MCYTFLRMDHDMEQKINQLMHLTEENNRLLRKVRRVQKWGQITSTIRYIVVIGIAVGAFYFLKPYYDAVIELYDKGNAQINSIQDFFASTTKFR